MGEVDSLSEFWYCLGRVSLLLICLADRRLSKSVK